MIYHFVVGQSIFHLCVKNALVNDFVLKEMGHLSQKIAGKEAQSKTL